ncbi:hypothetical protein [Clostridium saccharoperbutylacetonicum]|uniref:hypothetical protein n=1 Tax=Clostridium saccharoperbutylacetonicum TaxID=36745 RepID=UPI000983F390|nr:hypothetical protein [Clostridium saccharoperbutylacetonicum]AQR96095.1 hypothetical protein CLSAP_34130 [Clostridium saccharoperbutylacetonicum]NSB31964.1 hypothetical protein [Clostridium saccharoperbutylacetonicum]
MKTLIIYDNTGYIYLQITGSYRIPQGGLNYLEVDEDSSKGKIIKSVNVETKELVLEDVPKTELEKTQDQLLETQAQLANLQEQILVKENGGK